MKSAMTLQCPGILFSLSAPRGAVFSDPQHAPLRKFISAAGADRDDIAFQVQFEVCDIPPIPSGNPLFNLRGEILGWHSAQALCCEGRDATGTQWVARYVPGASGLTVALARRMAQNGSDGILILPSLAETRLFKIIWMFYMAARGGVVCHAAAAVRNGRGLLFPARSGTGKSTLAGLLHRQGGFLVLGDDEIAVRRSACGWSVHGLPWCSLAGLAENAHAPLAAMFFLHQGAENRIREVTAHTALRRLLPTLSIPWRAEEFMGPLTDLAGGLAGAGPAFDLFFKPTADVAVLLREFIDAQA